MAQRDMFERLLASLHHAALDDTQWLQAAALIDEVCGLKGNMLVFDERRAVDEDVRVFMTRFCHRGRRREEWEYAYYETWHALDERAPRVKRMSNGQLLHVSELYTAEELKTSPVYNEVLPQADSQDSLIIRMEGPEGSDIVWAPADPVERNGWGSGQVQLIRRLVPHIRQYVLVRDKLAGADALGASVAGLLDNTRLAILYLDRGGRIVDANDQARGLLRSGSGLVDRDGVLGASLPDDDAKLQGLLARVLPTSGQGISGTVTIRHPGGLPRLAVHISPVGDSPWSAPNPRVAALAMVVLPHRRPQVDANLVAEALQLTRAESEVAAGLAQGRTVADMAASTNRREDSIRYHLKRIYRKRDLASQADLVRLVLSLRGLPSPRA